LGESLIKAAFGKFVNVEDVAAQENQGCVAFVVPNDSDVVRFALETLKLLPNFMREI